MRNFFKTLASELDRASLDGDVLSLAILSKLNVYISSGNFSKYKRTKDFLFVKDLTYIEAAKVLNLKETTVRAKRQDLSDEAYSLVGRDFFTRLKDGDFDYCESVVNSLELEDVIRNVIPKGVSDIIRGLVDLDRVMPSQNIALTDFEDELRFLVSVSEPMLKAKISNLDIEKLNILLGVLEGDVGSKQLQNRLINAILTEAANKL